MCQDLDLRFFFFIAFFCYFFFLLFAFSPFSICFFIAHHFSLLFHLCFVSGSCGFHLYPTQTCLELTGLIVVVD
jgi:hypothetical protein